MVIKYVLLLLTLLFSVSPSYAGQAYNPFSGRLDICVSFDDSDTTNAGCAPITFSTGLSLVDDGDGTFSVTASGGSGDITDVGDCTGPACFGGASGTVLTFEGDGGTDFTLTYDTTDDDFELSDDLTIEDATPHLKLTDTTASSDDFELYADGSQIYLTNVTDGTELLRFNSLNHFFVRGGSTNYQWPIADGTNGQFLTTNGSGLMTWTTSSGSGDVTSVGDCASGACFDGTQGTILTFNNASGDQTISFDDTTQDFEISNDITITDANPHLQFLDNTASSDDYEFYADGNNFYLTNVTDGLVLFKTNYTNFFVIPSSNVSDGDITWDRGNGILNVGPYTPNTILGTQAGIVITSNEGSPASFAMNAALGDVTTLLFATSQGDLNAPSISASGDGIYDIAAYGHDGSNFIASTRIRSEIDGTPGSSDMPGRLIFYTTLDGAGSVTERMRINNTGSVTIGSSGLNLAHLGSDGVRDEIQLLVQGFSTQTTNLVVFENSGGTDLFQFKNVGDAVFGGDLDLEDDTPHMRLTDTDTASDDFELWADGNQVLLTNVTDGIQLIRFNSNYDFFFRGTGVSYAWPTADGSNGQVLQTNGAGGLSWVTSSGTGDITSVGDVTTGAAFDGSAGTTLTFNDAAGDQTLLYNSGGDLDFNFSDDLNIRDATPHIQLVDTTASEDDFEWYANGSEIHLTNVTDGIELLKVDKGNNFISRRTWDIRISGAAVVSGNDEGQLSWDTDDDELGIGTGSITLKIGAFIASGSELADFSSTFDVPLFFTDNNEINESTTPVAMTCKNLYAQVDDAPGAGNSWTVTVTDDGVNSGTLSCVISGANLTCNDTSGVTSSISAGSIVEFVFTEAGTAGVTTNSSAAVTCYPDGN